MQKNLICLLIFISLISCAGQVTDNIKLDGSNVNEIFITNKLDCSRRQLVKGVKTIRDISEVKKIIDAFDDTENETRARGDVDIKNNYGFFDISFDEGSKHHFFSVIYTVYDGVVLTDNSNGRMYKNDRLEAIIYSMFVSN